MYPNPFFKDIVVSLELARQLKENNIVYPTLFYWRVWNDGFSDCVIGMYEYEKDRPRIKEKIPTYTSSQVIGKMPASIGFLGELYYFSISKNILNLYEVSYKPINGGGIIRFDQKLENALAKMLLWLNKTGIIK